MEVMPRLYPINEDFNSNKRPNVQPLRMKPQLLNNQVDIESAKKRKRRKRRAKPKKRIQSAEMPIETKRLDGFLLLHSCCVKYPHEAINSKPIV